MSSLHNVVPQWCVVDKENGEVKVQREEDHAPWCLENLMLCSTKLCTPDFIDRNYCFRVRTAGHTHTHSRMSLLGWPVTLIKTCHT